MNGRVHRGGLLAALRESLESGDLERIKRAADALYRAGGDPVAALSSIALNELTDGGQQAVALRTLEHLDSTTARSVADRLGAFPGQVQEIRSGLPTPRTAVPQRDRTKWWIFGLLTALAILWPAYSIYRFNHPRPADTPKPISPWTDQEVAMEARSACRSAVRQRLRDPGSADFPALSPSEVQASYSGEVKVKGYVHANNGMGLKVRADYLCSLHVDREARTLSILEAQLVQR